jgi:AcrR family transcriptional regulator
MAADAAAQAAAAVTDGRSLRRARSREVVVEAILDLLGEGHPRPTAQDVAERSGVSMRSIFRLFEDVGALHRAAVERQGERIAPMLHQLPDEGPTADRIAALVAHRTELFETIAPVRRFAVRLAPTSPPIAAELQRLSRFFRDQLARTFRRELDGRQRPAVLLEALDVTTSWEAWERLRTGQGLSRVDAADTVSLSLSALLRET